MGEPDRTNISEAKLQCPLSTPIASHEFVFSFAYCSRRYFLMQIAVILEMIIPVFDCVESND